MHAPLDATTTTTMPTGVAATATSGSISRAQRSRRTIQIEGGLSWHMLVARVEAGWPVAHVAEQLGISRATGYKWVARYRREGRAGLVDRPSRPLRSPHRLPEAAEAEILALRARLRYGPDRLGPLLHRPPSTVHRVLARHGLSRLADADRPSAAPVRRYVAAYPGALLHQDHKKLGRIPDGGGHRILGREQAPRHQGLGYDHLEVVVDEHSRDAAVVRVPDESARSAAWALETAAAEFAALGVHVERVLTDNGWAYTHGRPYAGVLERLGVRHKRTRPYRPRTNGKAERFIQTLLHEWAYARLYRSNEERLAALPGFVAFYTAARPHTALEGCSPLDVVNNVSGDDS